jgi:hypothetical protein
VMASANGQMILSQVFCQLKDPLLLVVTTKIAVTILRLT